MNRSDLFALLRAERPGLACDDAVDAILTGLERAERRWPELRLERREFVMHALSALSTPDSAELVELVWDDVYLAFACSRGLPAAIAELERMAGAELLRVAARLKLDADLVDETSQQLREKLLMRGQHDENPKIATYAGRGPLTRWLYAALMRTALSITRQTGRDRSRLLLDESQALAETPELRYLRDRYSIEYKLAFQDAVNALPVRARMLLRMHLVDGLTVDQMARIYGEHRSSIWRSLKSARESILDGARRALEERLKLTTPEFDSLIFVLRDDLDLSLSRLLIGDDA